MDYKAYTLMAIILASLALVVPIGTTYATTNATDGATTNATDGATTNEANVPAINATGGGGNWTTFDLTAGGQTLSHTVHDYGWLCREHDNS